MTTVASPSLACIEESGQNDRIVNINLCKRRSCWFQTREYRRPNALALLMRQLIVLPR